MILREEAREAFYAEADRRWANMKREQRGIPAAEMFKYLAARARGEKPARPKSRTLPDRLR